MNFFNLPSPYADFCVLNFHETSINPDLNTCLKDISNELGANLVQYQHLDGSSSQILYFNELNVDKSNFQFSLISGLAISYNKLLISPNKYLLEDYENIDEDFGQFTAFFLNEEGIDYKTDSFGAGHIYYYEDSDRQFSVVSNRAHLIKIILDKLRIKLSLNISLVKGTFFSDFHFFTQQSFLSEELIKEIKLLRLDECITQKSGGILLRENKNVTGMFDCSHVSYENLLNDFCDKSISNLQTVFNSGCFTQHILDLSGGKDSRLCLSLLLNTGFQDKVSILTNDVKNSDDLAISAGITNLLGLSYITEWNSKLKPKSLDEGFNLWRSYFFGNYHRMGFAAWSPCGENLKDIRISGASGGIYRSTWSTSSYFQKALGKYRNLKDVLKNVLVKSTITGRYAADELDELLEDLHFEFKQLPGNTIVDKIDNHYLYHRNRSHFGLRGFSFYNECLTLTPLLSPQLFKASRLLEYNERQSYRVFYDLYNKLAPFLLNIRFDRDNAPFSGISLNKHAIQNSVRFYLDESTEKWFASQLKLASSKKASYDGVAKMKWSEYLPKLKEESLLIKNNINELYPDLLPLDLDARINNPSISNREMSIIFSQLSSVLDNI